MADDGAVLLQLVPADADRPDEDLVRRLRADLRSHDLGTVGLRHLPPDPDGKSGLGPVEWVTVLLSAGRGLRDLLGVAFDWVRSTRRPIRVRIGGDELVLDNVSADQQERIIEAFFARHRSD